MDVNTIAQIVSSVGFPIACCIYLIYNQGKSEDKHLAEVERMRETVENNTKVMIRICSKLGVDDEEKRD